MVILLLSNKWDLTLDYVVQILKKREIQFIRLNTEDLVQKKSCVTFPTFSFSIDNKINVNNLANEVTSILLRRPGKPYEFTKHPKPTNAVINYVSDQWQSFLSGLQSISDILWINNPIKNAFAEVKINQLYTARSLKFKIPRTCITNDFEELESFWQECNGNIIAKALSTPLIKENNKEFFIFTNKLNSIENIKEKEMLLSPTIFQELITPKKDYRITVVGNECFAVEIKTSKQNSQIDWRRIKSGIKFVRCQIPGEIKDKCIKLVSELGLVFGAIDIVIKDNEYYFLEINPNGEWGWLQKTAKLPIAEALAEKLIVGKT